jgi:hypothetical protein
MLQQRMKWLNGVELELWIDMVRAPAFFAKTGAGF